MRRLACVLLVGGCERDPVFFGVWDLVEVERDGETQRDAGLFEILDNGEIALFLRYQWTGEAFVPDPRPSLVRGDTSQRASDDIGAGYQSEGETYQIWLSPFGTVPFDVVSHDLDRARLRCATASWPDHPEETLPTTLVVAR